MARPSTVVCVLWCGFLCLSVMVEAQVARENAAPEQDWADRFKKIPLGPGTLDIGGSARLRFEHLDNYNIKKYNTREDEDLLLERVRLNLDYHLGEDLHGFIEMQDAHYWLSQLTLRDFPTSCPYEDPVDLRQGFLEWTHIGETPLGFKVGRQAISYGDNRIWGPGEWGNVGRYCWDVGKLYFDTNFFRLDGICGKRVLFNPIGFDDDDYPYDVFGLYGSVKKLPMKLDLFYVYKLDDHGKTKGESGKGDLRRHTIGSYVDSKAGKQIDYRGTLAFQVGNEGKDNVEALGANARTGYTFDLPWKPRIGLEYSYASGDSNPKDSLNQTFDGVFGAIDSYYGRMNLFSWMNLRDYEISFGVKPTDKLDISLDYHYFELARKRDAWYYCDGKPQARNPSGGWGRALGQEIDLIATYKPTKHVELMAGYCRFCSGPFIDRACRRGDANSDWTFVQVMLSF